MGPIKLCEADDNYEDAMERNAKEEIDINLLEEFDEIYKVALRQSGKKLNDDWHLDRIELTRVNLSTGELDPETAATFKFNTWLKPKEIHESGRNGLEAILYTVRIKTSNKILTAGTDSDVSINIIGKKGQTQLRLLDNQWRDDFERGNVDNFKVYAVNLGDLTSVLLSKSGKDDWYVSYVEVDGPFGTSRFDFNDKEVTTGGVLAQKTKVQIPPKPVLIEPVVETLLTPTPDLSIKSKFTGYVVTSDKFGAGTDSKVDIWFTDSNGKTAGPITMQENGGDSMERGQKNELQVNLIDKLVDIYKIAIRHDGAKPGDQWHLDRIELEAVDLVTEYPISESPTVFTFKPKLTITL